MSPDQPDIWTTGPGPEMGSWSPDTSEWPVELLFRLTLEGAAEPEHVFSTPWGVRRETRAVSGRFEGPRLKGTVMPGLANDWGFATDDGVAGVDANIVLMTDDDQPVFMTCYGRMGADRRFRISPMFEASDGPLVWLTKVQAIGVGGAEGNDLVVDVFALK